MTQPKFDNLPLNCIRPSSTNPRKRFDENGLSELAISIKEQGVAQPILVRPIERVEGSIFYFEIVAGERRYRASGLAGMATIPALIRELTDAQALEIQVIENLQRSDLHPLEEAEGYEQLMKMHNMTADDLAAKVGKSKAFIYARLKLLALVPEAREAFYEGKLTPSTAILIARIPVKQLQAQAVIDITEPDHDDEPLSTRAAAEYIQEEYMLQLKAAPFDTISIELVPAAGACTTCPKRTGNQPELFADIESKDTCTDPQCFALKRDANKEAIRAKAIKDGRKFISGDEALKIKPHQWSPLQGGYINIDEKCYDDGHARTYRQIIGDAMPETVLFENPYADSPMIEIIKLKDIEKQLKKNFTKKVERKPAQPKTAQSDQRKKEDQVRENEGKYRRALFDAVRPKLGTDITRKILVMIALELVASSEQDEVISELHNIPEDVLSSGMRSDDLPDTLNDMASDKLTQLIIDLLLVNDIGVPWFQPEKNPPQKLIDIANEYKIDASEIRKTIFADADAKEKKAAEETKPKAKKKADEKVQPKTAKSATSSKTDLWPFPTRSAQP